MATYDPVATHANIGIQLKNRASSETAVKKHSLYADAKAGDADAAAELVNDTFNLDAPEAIKTLLHGKRPVLISSGRLELASIG